MNRLQELVFHGLAGFAVGAGIAAATAAPALALAPSPRTMTSTQAIGVLTEVVEATGTDVQAIHCKRGNVYGFYQYAVNESTGVVTDRVVLCTNGPIDWNNARSVLETLQHEAVHVAQACQGGPLFNKQWHFEALEAMPREDIESLGLYEVADLPYEIEAFLFENMPAELVIQLVLQSCERQIDARVRSLT